MPECTPCDLHAWQPVPLPDGRTAILCGKCGQHAVTLPAETAAPFLPAAPTNPTYAPIWVVPYWQQYPPLYPSVPPTITYGSGANALPAGPYFTPPPTGWQV